MRGLSLVAASGDHSSSRCAGLSLSRSLLGSTGSRRAGSVVVAHGPSCSAACGTFPDQGSNPCPLHWQADSQPLRHQGSPWLYFFSSVHPHLWSLSLSLSVQISSSYKDTNQIGLRPTLRALYFNHLFNFQMQSHSDILGIGASTYGFGGTQFSP